jgi:hypothetical protein
MADDDDPARPAAVAHRPSSTARSACSAHVDDLSTLSRIESAAGAERSASTVASAATERCAPRTARDSGGGKGSRLRSEPASQARWVDAPTTAQLAGAQHLCGNASDTHAHARSTRRTRARTRDGRSVGCAHHRRRDSLEHCRGSSSALRADHGGRARRHARAGDRQALAEATEEDDGPRGELPGRAPRSSALPHALDRSTRARDDGRAKPGRRRRPGLLRRPFRCNPVVRWIVCARCIAELSPVGLYTSDPDTQCSGACRPGRKRTSVGATSVLVDSDVESRAGRGRSAVGAVGAQSARGTPRATVASPGAISTPRPARGSPTSAGAGESARRSARCRATTDATPPRAARDVTVPARRAIGTHEVVTRSLDGGRAVQQDNATARPRCQLRPREAVRP